MRAKQHVYFGVWSDEVSAVEVEERVGMRSDHSLVRGSKDPERPLPVQPLWAIESRRRDTPLYEQIEEVLARIAPIEEALRALRFERRDVSCVLQVVRYLNDPDAPERETLPLGFGLDHDELQLLARLEGRLDVDEYDCLLGDE